MSQVLYCDRIGTASSEGIFGPRGQNENGFSASSLATIFFMATSERFGDL